MKAIIVEIQGRHAAVLTDDGVVSKVKNRNYCLGQEIVIKNNNNLVKMLVSAAAAIMIFITPAWAYLTPYSYVSLDVNPSFEFSINRFDRVLTVKAVNDNGEELLKDINIGGLKNKEIRNAIISVLTELKNQGYIVEGEECGVIVATSSKTQSKTDVLSKKLRTTVNEEVTPRLNYKDTEIEIKENPEESKKQEKPQESERQETETNKETEEFTDDIKPEKLENSNKSDKSNTKQPEKQKEKFDGRVIEVTEKEVDEAKKLGVTPGKLNLVEKLQEAAELAGYEVEIDEWLDKSVQEINVKIREYNEETRQKEENRNNNEKTPSDKGNPKSGNSIDQGSSNDGNEGKGRKH